MTSQFLKFTLTIVGANFLSIAAHSAIADVLIPAVAATGTGSFTNSPSLIINGVVPPRGTNFASSTNVHWIGSSSEFTIDLGAIYTVSNLIGDLDCNDDYLVRYSTNNLSYTNLFTFLAGDGPVQIVNGGGMDILTTDPSYPSSVIYPGDSTTPVYVGRGFSPVSARYLKISGSGGDNVYAIGELQVFQPESVPEPASIVMLATGAVGMATCARRKLKRVGRQRRRQLIIV